MSNYYIDINHSSIVVHNYNLGDCKYLEKLFSIWDAVTFSLYYKGIYYDEENRDLYLPRGIDIGWLENKFPHYIIRTNTNADPYDTIDQIRIKYLPRDSKQEEALKFLLGIDQYKNNRYRSQLSLNLNTGVGKTYCCITAVSYLRVRPIMITYSVNWVEQWRDFILEYTDIKPNEIYIISGTPSIKSLLKKDMSDYKFILATHGTLRSYGDTYGWDKVHELFKHMRCGLKIFDECHLNLDNMYMIDFHSNTRQTFYVTATPLRSDEQENKIFQYYFKNVPNIDLFDEETDKRTAYIAIRYNSEPTPKDISRCKNKYGLNRSKYTDYVVTRPNFYTVLRMILNIVIKGNKKTLFFIGTNNGIEVVYNWILENYPEIANDVGVYNSTVTENKMSQLDKKFILSTTKSCGAAQDIKGLQVVVVLAEPFKSEILARQTLGRCRDKNTTYIEVVDDGFIYTRRYYYTKQKIFAKYATECTEIKFTKEELANKVNIESAPPIKLNGPKPGIVRYREYKAKPNSGVVFYEEIID